MGNATIALYTGSTTPLVPEDAESVTVAGIPTVRQRNQVTGAADTEIARVQATTPGGTEMGLVVRIAGPIPAGTAAIGKLAANSGVDIGDVDVSSLVPGTGQTALGKAIDVAAGGNDTGVAMLAVRRDSLVTLTPVDGDYVPPLTNAFGSVWVSLDHMPQVIGSIGHDSPDTQFPIKIGGYASAALRAAVTEGDRTDASFDLQGQLRVLPTFAAGTALIGDVGLQPRTSGGLTKFRSLDLDETEEEVKATAGQVYGYYFKNLHATLARFLKFYDNTAAGTTVGTTTPVLTVPMDAGEAGHIAIPHGLVFGTGITVAATTGLADADTGAPGANEVVVAVWFK